VKAWDRHCPECGSDDVALVHVKVDRLRKACAGCGHRWSEERELLMGPYAIEVTDRHMQSVAK
jgi:transcription elongation factor Elf1